MTSHFKINLTLIIAAAFSLSFLPTESQAQGFKFYGQNPFSFMGFGKADRNDEIGKKVHEIDSIAEQMAWRFGWETRTRRDCNDSVALLKLMKSHTGLTNDLIKAYNGDNAQLFVRTAGKVHDNLGRIQTLRKKVQISDAATGLITKSIPLTAYVHRNANLFRPAPTGKPKRPLYGAPPEAQSLRGNGNGDNAGFSNTGNGTRTYRG